MPPNPLKPFYRYAPIRDLDTLAEVLEVSYVQLAQIARSTDRSYRCVPKKKKNGSPRITWDAYTQLKAVQHLIKVRILAQVTYPLYLQGGIRDLENPRDYARNASIHAGHACVINEDIADFFPSTTAAQVRDIWRHVFRFPPEVAEILTALTTRRGELPQGAKTSNHLANLVFWRDEHELVRHLVSRGWTYSRLTDDITVSSPRAMSPALKSEAISKLYAFIKRNGFKPKYRKHNIFDHNERMLVNNLVVNEHPALPHQERHAIRSLVHKTTQALVAGDGSATKTLLNHVLGKIGEVKRFHPRTGQRLADKIRRAISQKRENGKGDAALIHLNETIHPRQS